MSELPLVTVVVVCFNHAQFAEECLESVRSQDYPNVELIVVDDRSTDGSAGLIDAWIRREGVECSFLRHEHNTGLCRALNEALELASGDYFAVVAADDVWDHRKISRQVAVMRTQPPEVALVYCDAHRIDERSERLPESILYWYRQSNPIPEGEVFEQLAQANFVPSLCPLVRMECMRSVGPYDEEMLLEDWDMWLRLASRYRFVFMEETLASYRVVDGSVSRRMGYREHVDHIVALTKHFGSGPERDSLLRSTIRRRAMEMHDAVAAQREEGAAAAASLQARLASYGAMLEEKTASEQRVREQLDAVLSSNVWRKSLWLRKAVTRLRGPAGSSDG